MHPDPYHGLIPDSIESEYTDTRRKQLVKNNSSKTTRRKQLVKNNSSETTRQKQLVKNDHYDANRAKTVTATNLL